MWKDSVLEILFTNISNTPIIDHRDELRLVYDSCAEINWKVWSDKVQPTFQSNTSEYYYDFTENYNKYYARTYSALKQLLKEDKIELLEEVTRKGGKRYKYKKPLLKYKFSIEKYATSNN